MLSEDPDGFDIKDWIRKELVSGPEEDQDLRIQILKENRKVVIKLFTLRSDGKVKVLDHKSTVKNQILAYVIGAAYAEVAELRGDDAVQNKELIDELKLKKGTVDSTVKRLREEDYFVAKKEGFHRINYKKLEEIASELSRKEGTK